MYSRYLLNRIVKMKSLLTSVTTASVRRRRQIGGIKYFSIATKHDYLWMYRSIKQPQFVSRIFCKKYSQHNSNPTESSIQKSQEELKDTESGENNQNQSSDKTPMSLCLKMCNNQSYQVFELNIHNSDESDDCVQCGVQMSQFLKGNDDKDIIDDKNGFCRAICLLPSLPDKTVTPVKTIVSSRKVADAKNVEFARTESPQTLSSSQSVPSAPTDESTRTDSCDAVIIADKNEFCGTICPTPALSGNTDATEVNDALTKNFESPQTVASNLIVASAENEAKPKSGERLIDKLTAEEIEEICNAKCSSQIRQELPKVSVEKVSPKNFFKYGSYSSDLTEIFGDKFVPQGKVIRMRKERRTAGQIRKIIPPASFPAQRHSYLSPGQRIVPSNQSIVNLVPDIRYRVHPCPAIPHEATKVQLKSVPQFMSHHMRKQRLSGRRVRLNTSSAQQVFHSNQKILNVIPGISYRVPFRPEIPDRDKGPQTQFRSSYGRMIRSFEKEKRFPIVIFPQIGRLNNASNSGNSGHFGYERIPYMPSNQLFNQTKQRRNSPFPQHRHTNKPTGTIFSDRPKDVQSPIPSIPIGPKSHIPNTSNIFQPIKNPHLNQTRMDPAKSQITSVKNPDKPGIEDFKLTENRSAMVYGPRKLKLISSPYPQIRNDKDVIIRMEYVNLTDTDARHYVTGNDNPYSFITTVAGRTGTGQIIEVGSAVTNVKPGDKVLIKRVSCGKCSLCLNDRGRLCESRYVSEMSSEHGTLTHFYVHPSEFLTKIPNNVKPINASMASTLSSAIRACQKASLTAGDNVVVINGGPLGTATILAAKCMGATSITLVDARKSILDQAFKLGIDHTFLIDPISPFRNTAMQIGEKIGDYPRLVFDCNGSQLTNQIAIYAAKTGGKVIFMRNDGNQSMVSVADAIMRDVDIIISTIGNDESERAALQFLKSGKMLINTDNYHHYDLSNVNEAFQHLLDPNRLGSSHVIVECQITNDAKKNKNENESKIS